MASTDTNAAPVTTEATLSTAAEPIPYEISPEKMFKDTLTFLFLMFAIFYFFLIRPQQKKLKAHRALMNELKKGDKIITNGGLMGVLTKLEGENVAVVEIAPNIRVRVARSMIAEKLNPSTSLNSDTANDN